MTGTSEERRKQIVDECIYGTGSQKTSETRSLFSCDKFPVRRKYDINIHPEKIKRTNDSLNAYNLIYFMVRIANQDVTGIVSIYNH